MTEQDYAEPILDPSRPIIDPHHHLWFVPEGDALLQQGCKEVMESPTAYYHQWKPTQMLTWDNWRMLHSVTGTDPKYPRRMHRTTIKGDYGLGYFENHVTGRAALGKTM